MRPTHAMSAMLSSGLLGVSHHNTLVFGRIAARTASRSDEVHRSVLDAPPAEHIVHQSERAAVRIARHDDVVARRAQRAQNAILGRQPARERQPARATLERRHAFLERGPRRVARPAVLPPVARAADGVLLVRRHLKDRRDDGPRACVGRLTRVNRARLEMLGWSGPWGRGYPISRYVGRRCSAETSQETLWARQQRGVCGG